MGCGGKRRGNVVRRTATAAAGVFPGGREGGREQGREGMREGGKVWEKKERGREGAGEEERGRRLR